MPLKTSTRNEMVTLIDQELERRNFPPPFLIGARDELVGAECEDVNDEYLAGQTFIRQLERGEEPTPISAAVCAPRVISKIRSHLC